jgi:DNA-directed RNA polymerase specialized sigma24 family protein
LKGSSHRSSAAPDATLQRVARMSPAEHERRLTADVETVLGLQLNRWSDEAWEPVAAQLADYGWGVMVGWLYTGKVFIEVTRAGYPVDRCPQSWLDDDAVDGIAKDVVAKAIREFRRILKKGLWHPEKGASLATYFVGQCKIQFANIYRSWLTAERKWRTAPPGDVHGLAGTAFDPPTKAVLDAGAADLLAQMDPRVATVFRLHYLDGYTYNEIAEMVPEIRNAKAVENMVTREKSRWSKQDDAPRRAM